MNKQALKTKTNDLPVSRPAIGDTVLVNRASLSSAKSKDMHELDLTRVTPPVLPTHSQEVTKIDAVYLDGSIRTSSGDVWRALMPSPTDQAKFLAIS